MVQTKYSLYFFMHFQTTGSFYAKARTVQISKEISVSLVTIRANTGAIYKQMSTTQLI